MAGDDQQQGERPGLLERYRQRYAWLDHAVRAGQSYTQHHGDHYAGAITYFSILSLVPLLMISFAVAGFVLAGNEGLLTDLREGIVDAAGPSTGETLNEVLDQAIGARGSVGVLGLLGALYSGLGWMGNLREALTAQWDRPHGARHGFVGTKVYDLLSLLALGLALVASFAVTGIGSQFGRQVLDLVGLGDELWARLLFRLVTIVLALAGNWLVFVLVIARLPREPVSLRSAMRAAVLGAVGFEVLKQVFSFYLGTVTQGPTGAAFGSVIGLMVFAFFVSRFLLFVAAWAATSPENLQPAVPDAPPPAVISPQVVVGARPDARAAAGLVGVGAAVGAGLAAVLGRRRL